MQKEAIDMNDEIDLHEFFFILWSHKILIAIITGLFIFASGYYSLTAQKIYTAKAVFEIKQNNPPNLSFSGEFGALASLAGISGAKSSGSDVLLERLMEREFILQASENLSLENDPFFLPNDADKKDPLWKAILKNFIGLQKSNRDDRAIVEQTIQKNYLEYVNISTTSAGAIGISVTLNPKLQPNMPTKLWNKRQTVAKEDEQSKEERLSYLAETLADAIQDMEAAQQEIKNYTLSNSAAAQENFILGSLRLDTLREEKKETVEYIATLKKIRKLVQSGNLNRSEYESLKTGSPLVDDISFRRILGMSETISVWNWPSLETIDSISITLTDRVNRLNVEIKDLEQSAKAYATSAEDQAKLLRDVKISEATFSVLTEQVKSQTLVAGFKPETFTVFAYATPPLEPSFPNRNLTLIIGTGLGVLTGLVSV